MNFIESFRIAIKAIASNKMRSFLTMLGLIIGISSVVTIISIGNASKAEISGQLGELGTNVVYLQYNSYNEDDQYHLTDQDYMVESDLEKIYEAYKDKLDGVIPIMGGSAVIADDVSKKQKTASLDGVITMSESIDSITMLEGRFVNDTDIVERKSVVVIDQEIAKELYTNNSNAIGQKVFLNNGVKTEAFTVVGVYEKKQSTFGDSGPSFKMPYTRLQQYMGGDDQLNGIKLAIKTDEDPTAVASQVIRYMERVKGNEGENKYQYFSLQDQLEVVNSIMGNLTLMVSAIAGISLLVGGIGVMNIMLVSVTERTREIGIRKALGAKRHAILSQFLIEAVVVAGLGGIFGTIFGMIFAQIAASFLNFSIPVDGQSILLATVFSAAVGIFFGMYPANRAAKLDPIEALRYE